MKQKRLLKKQVKVALIVIAALGIFTAGMGHAFDEGIAIIIGLTTAFAVALIIQQDVDNREYMNYYYNED